MLPLLLMMLLMLLLIMVLLLLLVMLLLVMIVMNVLMVLLLLPYCYRFVWFGWSASDGPHVVRHGGAAERRRRPTQAEDCEGSEGLLARAGVLRKINPTSSIAPAACRMRVAPNGASNTFRTGDGVDWVPCSRLPPLLSTNTKQGFPRTSPGYA